MIMIIMIMMMMMMMMMMIIIIWRYKTLECCPQNDYYSAHNVTYTTWETILWSKKGRYET